MCGLYTKEISLKPYFLYIQYGIKSLKRSMIEKGSLQ